VPHCGINHCEGEATSGEEAIALAEQLQPDVILDGYPDAEDQRHRGHATILHTSPHIRVLMVTMSEDDAPVFTAMRDAVVDNPPYDHLILGIQRGTDLQ
jgi:DNA-binding NarL/FixJ family response regulator